METQRLRNRLVWLELRRDNADHMRREPFFLRCYLAEGARFELAAHEVGAGFQDRWIKPLSHPSEM